MTLVVGYDGHQASKAAVTFAGNLGAALHEDLHIVRVHDLGDTHPPGSEQGDLRAADSYALADRERIGSALDRAGVEWAFCGLHGDPATALLDAADTLSASMIVIGRPERGLGATLGHLVTSAVARTLIRRSPVPVVVVPE